MNKLILTAAVFVLTGSAAFAHSELLQSMPANKAMLNTAPKEITLHFSEPVRLTELKLHKEGKQQNLAPLPKDMRADFAIPAPDLETGNYVVDWRALSDDGHVVHGEFVFMVMGRPGQTEHHEHAQEQ